MPNQGKKKILIIDDDPFISDMYVLKFQDEGYSVEVAKDGKMGLERILAFQPDIVLLDIVMPSMDGFDVMQKLTAEYPPEKMPKIIFLTNFGQKEDIERGIRLGADDYIIKAHFTPSEVAEKVKQVLAQ
ncbi:MAG: response regulator [Candidatus Sungbacteria bacterium]|nr:response regulator [Candidatus Sungbacteria bacterium]